MIKVPFGAQVLLIELDIFAALHGQLEEEFRAAGFVGRELDQRIADALPWLVASVVGAPEPVTVH